jgi:hypothetical protein
VGQNALTPATAKKSSRAISATWVVWDMGSGLLPLLEKLAAQSLLVIESEAKRRLANEYDVAQEQGEISVNGQHDAQVLASRHFRRACASMDCRPLSAPTWPATCFMTSALRGASFLFSLLFAQWRALRRVHAGLNL